MLPFYCVVKSIPRSHARYAQLLRQLEVFFGEVVWAKNSLRSVEISFEQPVQLASPPDDESKIVRKLLRENLQIRAVFKNVFGMADIEGENCLVLRYMQSAFSIDGSAHVPRQRGGKSGELDQQWIQNCLLLLLCLARFNPTSNSRLKKSNRYGEHSADSSPCVPVWLVFCSAKKFNHRAPQRLKALSIGDKAGQHNRKVAGGLLLVCGFDREETSGDPRSQARYEAAVGRAENRAGIERTSPSPVVDSAPYVTHKIRFVDNFVTSPESRITQHNYRSLRFTRTHDFLRARTLSARSTAQMVTS